MFTIQQIEDAHLKVKSGADFPLYIQEIKNFGVIGFETWVIDSHTNYWGKEGFHISSESQYAHLTIAENSNKEQFIVYLKKHQKGETNYYSFCQHCAETGIEKWVVSLDAMTCTYYDKDENEILVEIVPSPTTDNNFNTMPFN